MSVISKGDDLQRRAIALSKVLCLIAAFFPFLAAAGWILDVNVLKKVHASLPAMQPNTACGLALAAAAILLTGASTRRPRRVYVARGIAVAILVFGLLTLSEYLFAVDLGIDRLFIRESPAPRHYPGRPAPQTAASFAALGAALLIYNSRLLPIRAGQVCALIAGSNATLAATGYIFSTRMFYGFPSLPSDKGMAVHTAATFMLLTAALLCTRPGEGLMSLVTSDTISSVMARRIFLTAVLAPPLVGAITRIGVAARWYDESVQISLFVVILMGLVLRTTWQAAKQSQYDELRARAALEDSQAANVRLRKAMDERRVFEALVENSSDFIGIADPNGKPVYLNPAGRRMVGLPSDFPVTNTEIVEYYPLDQRAFASDVILKSMVEQGQWKGETCFRHWQTQDAIPVSDTHFMIQDRETARVLGMGTITRDITDRKRLEEELRLSEAKAWGIVSVSADAIICVDENQRITLFNDGAEKIYGYSRTEALGAPLDILIPPRLRSIHREHMKGFASGVETARRMGRRGTPIIGLRKDGKEFPADAAIAKLDVEGKRIMTVSVRDMTEQKRREDEQTFLAEAGALSVSMLGYEEALKEIAGLAVRDLADLCIVDVVEGGKVRRVKAAAPHTSKGPPLVSSVDQPLDQSYPSCLTGVLEGKQSVINECLTGDTLASFLFREPELQAFREAGLASMIAVPLMAHGKLVGMMIALSSGSSRPYDRHDLRLVEALAQRTALWIENAQLFRETQRAVKTREEILAIVSHDLKNPVTTISLVAEMIRGSEQIDAARLRQWGGILQRSVDKMMLLIADLLDFAKIQSGTFSVEPRAEQLRHLLLPVIDIMKVQAEVKRQALDVALPHLLPEVAVDANRIGQVLANLLGNAIKFTPDGGVIRVSAYPQESGVVVSVVDTGPGIPPENLPRIFDRFWQGREAWRAGSGLGLSIAKGIVEAHGGRIWAESQPGKGSSFFFTVPLADSGARRTQDAA